ncbi:hypothetical protein Droror1_Dr00004212 [Drosera rotundifolia]
MRTLALQISQSPQLRRILRPGNVQTRRFSSFKQPTDELTIEEEAERKIGWLLKLLFAGTATAVGYHLFPYMGVNVMQQSISLLQVKDPLFKRIGASRLARFAINDEQRRKIVDMDGAEHLLNMLEAAKDDKTRKEALRALAALAASDEAANALSNARAISVIKSAADSKEELDIGRYKSSLMKRLQQGKDDLSS